MDLSDACAQLEARGTCVLEGLLDPAACEAMDARARSLMAGRQGYAKLEGALNPIPELAPLCHHPAMMEVARRFLGSPFYLANNVCLMWCQPGADGGRLHADWPLGDVPRPYPIWPMLLQTMWMRTSRRRTGRRVSSRPAIGPVARRNARRTPRASSPRSGLGDRC